MATLPQASNVHVDVDKALPQATVHVDVGKALPQAIVHWYMLALR